MAGYINTIKDLEAATYGMSGSGGNSLLKAAGVVGGFGTPHDAASNPFSAAANLGDLYNVLYGQKVWSMINREINALSMLPKKPWNASGWRILKGRSVGGNDDTFSVADLDTLGGQSENATISSITEVAPTY